MHGTDSTGGPWQTTGLVAARTTSLSLPHFRASQNSPVRGSVTKDGDAVEGDGAERVVVLFNREGALSALRGAQTPVVGMQCTGSTGRSSPDC